MPENAIVTKATIRPIGAVPTVYRRLLARAGLYRCMEAGCLADVVADLNCPCGHRHLFCREHAAAVCREHGIAEPDYDAFLERN
jgi:hypothetical protein